MCKIFPEENVSQDRSTPDSYAKFSTLNSLISSILFRLAYHRSDVEILAQSFARHTEGLILVSSSYFFTSIDYFETNEIPRFELGYTFMSKSCVDFCIHIKGRKGNGISFDFIGLMTELSKISLKKKHEVCVLSRKYHACEQSFIMSCI